MSGKHKDEDSDSNLSGRDMTERKQMEFERAHLLSQLRATLEATPDGIIVVGKNGKIKVVSKRFQEIVGIPYIILDSLDANQVLAYVLGMLNEPDPFLEKVKTVAADSALNTFDIFYLKDGRVLEAYSRPQRLEDTIIGRVWGGRDVFGTLPGGKSDSAKRSASCYHHERGIDPYRLYRPPKTLRVCQ